MAFLDIMPLSPGHLLITTRKHHEKISDVTEEEARDLGAWLPRLSRVLANATGVWDWNIVQNNGIAPSIKNFSLCITSIVERMKLISVL
jgi:diadenosine tetraphosphate (Ap4A) HIT family hydrolase